MYVFCYFEVEARIVDKDDDIWLPFADVLLTHLHILEDGTQVQQHRDKPHIGQLAVVTDARASNSSHQVAAKETELRRFVSLLQSLH